MNKETIMQTEIDIVEFNKKCAKFLGWHLITADEFNRLGEEAYTHNNKNIKWGILEYLMFHKDWNLIHEVLDSIEKLGFRYSLNSFNNEYVCILSNGIEFQFIGNDKNHSSKEVVIQAINSFLIWDDQKNQIIKNKK